MKKTLISILSSLMIITCLSFNAFAEDTPSKLESTDPVEIPEEYITKVTNIAINFAWAFSGGGKLLFGSCLSGGIIGIVDIASDLLEQVIYFGPSQEELDRQELMDKLNSIDASIGDVNSKVDSLADQINASIKQIDAKLDNISIKLDKDNITDVSNVASYLKNEMNNYDSVLTSQIHTWYENKRLDNYLTANKFVLKVPNGNKVKIMEGKDEYMDELDVIYIDSDLMSSVINAYTLEQLESKHNDGWDADKKDDIALEIFKRIINSEDFDKSSGSQFDTWIKKINKAYTNWDDFGNKEEVINTLANAGYGTLCEIAARNIAKSSNGADTYVKSLIDKFTIYCNYLTESEGEYTSPLASYANIYSSIYAFQGDLKRTIEIDEYDEDGNKTGRTKQENTNLLKISKEKYIGELNQLGSFVGIMAKASGNYGEESDMRKLIYIPWAAAEKKLEDDYAKYYHIKDGVEVDNYCYITKSVIGYFEGTLYSDLVMKFYAWENGFGTDIKSYRDTYMNEDWTFNMDNNQMVDSTNMSLIYAHYANTNGNIKFEEYLNKDGIETYPEDNLPKTLVTRFIGGRDFTSDDSVKMFVKNCHNNPDKWSGKDYLKGDTTTVTSSSKYFKVRRKATADVFDMETGVATLGKRIGAVASFYEKYTFKDDLVVFWDAEYNNPQTKEELIALAKKDQNNLVYWRDRYDTSDDDEERYRSHVEYCRNYGVLLSYPLDSPSAPIPRNIKLFGSNVTNNILNIENNALLEALKKAGISKKEYEDFCYDDTYRIYFDETKYDGIIDEELYTKLFNYCENDFNVKSMTLDYYRYNDLINDMLDNIFDKSLKDVDVNEITKLLIENDLDCVTVDKVPSKNLGKNVYNIKNGKLYIWYENKYQEYKANKDIKIKSELDPEDVYLASEEGDSEYFISKFNTNLIEDKEYPTISSKDLSLNYQIKTILAFELYFDDFGGIRYKVHPIYDVTPQLVWSDGKTIKQKEVSDKVLDKANVKNMSIMLPIIKQDNVNDNRATVKHFVDMNQMETPLEQIKSVIKNIGKYKYANVLVSSFSPYVVSNTFFAEEGRIDDKDKGNGYIVPNTGIH